MSLFSPICASGDTETSDANTAQASARRAGNYSNHIKKFIGFEFFALHITLRGERLIYIQTMGESGHGDQGPRPEITITPNRTQMMEVMLLSVQSSRWGCSKISWLDLNKQDRRMLKD